MLQNKIFIIDFDSTFIKAETLDILAQTAMSGSPGQSENIDRICEITREASNGKIPFSDSLRKRIGLLKANRSHFPAVIARLKESISGSFLRNRQFFMDYTGQVYIISTGFREIIEPVVKEFGIKLENVFANTFLFEENGNISGFDTTNILSTDNGKVELLRKLNLQGDIHVIGDGYSDYQIKAAGFANRFYAFTENIERENVLEKADHIAPSLDEVLFQHGILKSLSYPKNRIHVLLLENIHPRAEEILSLEGYTVETCSAALDEAELAGKIGHYSILGIRSKTKITPRVIENAHRLMAIGVFCIGTNHIDLDSCLDKGIAVFNAPFSNTRSVVELAIGEIIMLIRKIPDKSAGMHRGVWDKSATGSYEIRGKKLGIVGYGNIGSQLSVLAEALGMEVYYYDITEKLALGNARKCTDLEELLRTVDIISLHVDGRKENSGLIGEKEFSLMKDGVIFLNLSRGHVVDLKALARNINSGKIAGASIDVYPNEPKRNDEEFISELTSLPNTLLTPHIGGSTLEAQRNIAGFVPAKIIDYINSGSTANSVNFPEIQLPAFKEAHRLIHIHHNVPGVLASINRVLASHNINVLGQFLKTNEKIGYTILAVDKEYDGQVIKDLKMVDHTIRFRVLY